MPGRLAGKTALITAAGVGIGRGTAERFVAEGAVVWATDRDEALLTGLGNCHARRLDVTDSADIEAVIAEAGVIDILFNCAGLVETGSILDCDESEWARSFDTNVTAMYRTIRATLPTMAARGSGSIINMSSVASSIKGVVNRFVYGTTKAAVIGLTKAVAADFAATGIRCNAICPGTVDTPSLQMRLHATGDYDAARAVFVARQPMGRFASIEDVAAVALHLASDESSFITGQCHVIDGGWSN